MTKMSQQKKQVASTFIYWECPLQNLLYMVCVFLFYAINIMSVCYAHKATFSLTTLNYIEVYVYLESGLGKM